VSGRPAGGPLDAVAIGAHPDDVELGCGGTVALLAAGGRRVGVIHLTRGEAGTRGTAAERRGEAERAAEALGAAALELLDCGDGGLRTGPAEEEALIAVLRRWRPELVLGPPPADRHPDHGRAHALVAAACFYAGLRARGAPDGAPPHRPAAMFHYMQHDVFEPAFVVDVGGAPWEAKRAALACYPSQLHPTVGGEADGGGFGGGGESGEGGEGGQPGGGPVTRVSTRGFALAVEGRARHFGELIGAELGEPFGSRQPLAVRDPFALLPGGVR
jgi:bacillithiol biosynthesis deacetylase BshB1